MNSVSQIHCAQGTSVCESATNVAAFTRQSLNLGITTAEGDQVTLSSASTVVAASVTHEGEVTTQASCFVRASQFELSVQGDLSHEEIGDISKAIRTYGKVVKDMVNGRLQPAEAHARQLTRLEEISSVSGSVTLQQYFSAHIETTAFERIA